MTRFEQKIAIQNIQYKGFLTEDDKHILWEVYTGLFGRFIGNLGCNDCIRDAFRRIEIELANEVEEKEQNN